MTIVRVAIALSCTLLCACPGTPPKGGGAGGGPAGGGKVAKAPAPDAGPGDQADPEKDDGRGPLVSADGIACVQPSCVYHAGADGYFACLAAGEGTCFHFGPSCTPPGRCMFDAKSGSYRACEKADEGRCLAFGAACEPEGGCYYNPADRRHHACARKSGDRCAEYGGLCESR